MNFREIIAISGQPGLFRFIAQGANGVIVESLADGRRTTATGSAKVSALAEIAIFTDEGEMPLAEVFDKLYAKTGGKPAPDPKSPTDKLRAMLAEVAPTFDRERVHASDLKKIAAWFNTLIASGMTEFSEPEEKEK